MAKIHQFTFNLFGVHTMICTNGSDECVVIDPGFYTPKEKEEFLSYVSTNNLEPKAVLLTHGHIDHIWGVKAVQDIFGIPVYMSPEDEVLLNYDSGIAGKLGLIAPDSTFKWTAVSDGMHIPVAGLDFEVITTPGHSPGSVCYLDRQQNIMFTGDTLFAGTIGRTDLQYGEYDDIIRSIMEKLIWLEPDIEIYPGHGHPSTIGVERTSNPFLEPFNEKEELTESDPR